MLSWIVSFSCYSQTDSTYCLPMSKARLLVEAALKLRTADSVNTLLNERVALLEREKNAAYQSYTNLLNLSEQKYQKQKEITSDFVRLSEGWRKEADYYQRRYRKKRNHNKVITFIAIAAIGWAAVK